MKTNKETLQTIAAIISILVTISLVIIPIFTSRNYQKSKKEIIKKGEITVGIVYKTGGVANCAHNYLLLYFFRK